MKKKLIIIISIGIFILSSIIFYNVVYKSLSKRNIQTKEEIKMGDSKEEILKYLKYKYEDKDTEILFSSKNEKDWIFIKRTKKEKTTTEIYRVDKETKEITINKVNTTSSFGM